MSRIVPSRRARGAAFATLISLLASVAAVTACGETRRPIGDECLRGDDCLSGVCSSRTCIASPTLVNGPVTAPPDEMPLVPIVDAGLATDAPTDAKGGG